jgi:hypothetical protein
VIIGSARSAVQIKSPSVARTKGRFAVPPELGRLG